MTHPESNGGSLALQRVRKAYEQVYDQLKAKILAGELTRGHRLPTEVALATQFGVSRGTIREALRLLAAENLLRTGKGAGGGNFVMLPTVDHISEFVTRNIELLSHTDDLTLAEFMEARELIETFAVRQAATRRTDSDLTALRATLAPEGQLAPYEQYLQNKDFHSILVGACGNSLLQIAAEPIFYVLSTHMQRSNMPPGFPEAVCREHSAILERIEAGNPDEAEALMREHLANLTAVYDKIWQSGASGPRPEVAAAGR